MPPKNIPELSFLREEKKHFLQAWLGLSPQVHVAIALALILMSLGMFYLTAWRAPADFPQGSLITITAGSSLSGIAQELKEASAIRSEVLFKILVTLSAGDGGAVAGDYFFDEKLSIQGISQKISYGLYGLTPLRITIPEGITIYEIAKRYDDIFPEFDSVHFLEITKEKEGYLFPDTYLFLPNVHASQVVREMEENFQRKIAEIEGEILQFGKPLKDVVIMASLLEKEARKSDTRRMIAGILWHRLDIGMLLQVDAVFPYIMGKNTFQVSLEDLKVDSPYNTYKYVGLPIGPITNPGLDSLKATVNPMQSSYLFYLSDREGDMHYAETFAGHLRNKELYLK